jgi:hypothetical protein
MKPRGVGAAVVGGGLAAILLCGAPMNGLAVSADGATRCDGDTECLTVNATGTYVESIVMGVSVPGGTVGSSNRQWCGGVETTSTDGRRLVAHLCAHSGSPSYATVPVKASVPSGTTFCMDVSSTDSGSNYTPTGHPCLTVT